MYVETVRLEGARISKQHHCASSSFRVCLAHERSDNAQVCSKHLTLNRVKIHRHQHTTEVTRPRCSRSITAPKLQRCRRAATPTHAEVFTAWAGAPGSKPLESCHNAARLKLCTRAGGDRRAAAWCKCAKVFWRNICTRAVGRLLKCNTNLLRHSSTAAQARSQFV